MRKFLFLIIVVMMTQASWAKNIRYPEMYIQFKSLEQEQSFMEEIFEKDISELNDDLKKKNDGSKVTLNIISEKKALSLFKTLQGKKQIPFDYAPDGCYARAHRMSLMAQRRGVITGKVFIEGKLDPFPNDGWSWRYHVAPVVAVKIGKHTQLQVIDPSLFDRPVSISEWSEKSVGSMISNPFNIILRNRFAYNYNDMWSGPKKMFSIWDLLNTRSTLRKYRR
jgi:hypothetical protein